MREALRTTTRLPAESSLEQVIQMRAAARLRDLRWAQGPAHAVALAPSPMAPMRNGPFSPDR